MHALFEQISDVRHLSLHAPQFFASVALSTQRRGVPHIVCVGTDPQGRQVPPIQLPVGGQIIPQTPQLFGSVFRSVQNDV